MSARLLPAGGGWRSARTRPEWWARATGALLLLALVLGPTAVRADTITLRGSSIGMRGIEIDDVRSGRVFYRDHRGRRQWRELDEVDAIGFDDLPQLDRAETLFSDGDTDAVLAAMLQALIATSETDDELRRLWVHVRLLRLHVARGETVAAASHFASVVRLRDDPWWRFLEPNAPMAPTPVAVTAEARRRLVAAAEAVQAAELRAVVRRLRERLQPVHEAAQQVGGPAPTGETYSGYTLEQIRVGVRTGGASGGPAPRPPALDDTSPEAPSSETAERSRPQPRRRSEPASASRSAPAPPESSGAGPSRARPGASHDPTDRLDALDALLEASDASGALAACERIAARPGSRSIGRFLHQYGQALLLAERPRDAAVMFLRRALLFEDADEAAPSLIAAARIHIDVLHRPRAARRLLDRAILLAADRPDVVASARALLDGLPNDAPKATAP